MQRIEGENIDRLIKEFKYSSEKIFKKKKINKRIINYFFIKPIGIVENFEKFFDISLSLEEKKKMM